MYFDKCIIARVTISKQFGEKDREEKPYSCYIEDTDKAEYGAEGVLTKYTKLFMIPGRAVKKVIKVGDEIKIVKRGGMVIVDEEFHTISKAFPVGNMGSTHHWEIYV